VGLTALPWGGILGVVVVGFVLTCVPEAIQGR